MRINVKIPPIFVALLIQAIILALHFVSMPYIESQLGYPVPVIWKMVSQGIFAALVTPFFRLSYWWVIIQLVAPSLLFAALAIDVPLWVFPVILIGLLAVFWNVIINRVPLYLTNQKTSAKLASLLPSQDGLKFADLGSGLGGTLREIAALKPDQQFTGYETAPLPYVMSWVLTRLQGPSNVSLYLKSFWKCDLGQYDVLYCFLSPVPMGDLYEKAAREMKPGSLFISNSFTVPGHKPDRIVTVKDGRKTQLMIWKIKGR